MKFEEIDEYCDLFETQLRADPKLKVEHFLAEQGLPASPELVAELNRVAADHAARHKPGRELSEGAQTSDMPESRRVNESIGPYKLLQSIGEGGMGVVYMAEQESPVQRRVALKVIKPGLGSSEIIARFESERQALALMDHENIAKMFDAGTADDGRPYFVMELVRGVPLTQFCDDHRLPIKDRLKLFVTVCQAVQHAHQKGIIHRDLKPSNVLVSNYDGRAVPKIIDFGVAKAMQQKLTDKTLFTEFGRVVGTLQYMSPEQAGLSQLDIDTRSDIYSLGVLLYELLTGATPIDKEHIRQAGWERIMQLIREVEPPKPSTKISESAETLGEISEKRHSKPAILGSLVRGDLDWIVMKALAKDRSRRYATASGFAVDIERHLAGDVVEARPPSWLYRASRFVQKHRTAIGVSAGFALVLLVGAVISAVLAYRAIQAQHKATIALAAEKKARTAESDALAAAEKRLAQLESGTRLLGRMFEDLNPSAGHLDSHELRDVLAQKLRQLAGELVVGEIADPPVVAHLKATLGNSLGNLGYWSEAIELLEESESIYRVHLADTDAELLWVRFHLAIAYGANGEIGKATSLAERVLEQFEELPKVDRSGISRVDVITKASSYLATLYQQSNRYEDAAKLVRRIQGEYSSAQIADAEMLAVFNNIGMALNVQGKWHDAVAVFEECKRFLQDNPEGWSDRSIVTLNNLVVSYHGLGRYEDALETQELAVEIARQELAPEDPRFAELFQNLGACYQAVGEVDKAIGYREQSLEWMRINWPADHPNTLTAIHNLAESYRLVGRRDQALAFAREAYEKRAEKHGKQNILTISSLGVLANCLSDTGDVKRAIELVEACLEANRRGPVSNHPTLLSLESSLSSYHFQLGEFEEAITHSQSVCDRSRKILGPRHPDTALYLLNLGTSCLSAERWGVAMDALSECVDIYREQPAERWLRHAAQAGLGLALAGQGKFVEAEAQLQDACSKMKAMMGTVPLQRQTILVKVLEYMQTVYEMWDKAEPGQGYDLKATEWREQREAAASRIRAALQDQGK